MKFNFLLAMQRSVFIFTFFCFAFQNEELPSRSCPSLTRSDALSPRWQHIYIVAMDTASITLCMAFTDLQIKDASLRVMSDKLACVFHTQPAETWWLQVSHAGAWSDSDWHDNQWCINGVASMCVALGVYKANALAHRCAILNSAVEPTHGLCCISG